MKPLIIALAFVCLLSAQVPTVPNDTHANVRAAINTATAYLDAKHLIGAGAPSATCSAVTNLGRIYVRNDAAAPRSSFYVCTESGVATYSWEGPFTWITGAPGTWPAFVASATTDTTNASNISSGTLGAARLPNPGASTLGGIESITVASHQFLTGINTSGVPSQAQPAASDVSGLAASATTDTTNAANISSGTLNHSRLPALVSGDIPNNAANTSGTAGNATEVNGLAVPASQPCVGTNSSSQIVGASCGGGGGTGNAAASVSYTPASSVTLTCPSSSAGTDVVFVPSGGAALAANMTITYAGCTVGQIAMTVVKQAASGGPYTVSGQPTAGPQISQSASATTTYLSRWDGSAMQHGGVTIDIGPGQCTETAAPSINPPAGYMWEWCDSTDHMRESRNSSGTIFKSGNATQVNGAAVPASQACVGTNSSSQIVGASCGGGTGNAAASVAYTPASSVTLTCPSSSAGTDVVFVPSGGAALAANMTITYAGCTVGQIAMTVVKQAASGGPFTVTGQPSSAPQISQSAGATTTYLSRWDGSAMQHGGVTIDTGPGQCMETAAPSINPPAGYMWDWCDSTDHMKESRNSSGTIFKAGGTGNAASVVTTTFSATPTFTCPSSSAGTVTVFELSTPLSANITSSTLSGCTAGQTLSFVFQQASSGGPYSVAMPTGFDPVNVKALASSFSNVTYLWDGTNGRIPSLPIAGLQSRAVTGTTSTDTILVSDNNESVEFSGSVAVAETLPTPTTLKAPAFFAILANATTGSSTAVTVTSTTWTINGAATLVIQQGQSCRISVDPAVSSNWLGRCSEGSTTAGSNITLTRSALGVTVAATGGGGGGITTQSVDLGAGGTAVRAVNTIYHNIFSVTGAAGPIFVSVSCDVLTAGASVNLQMVTGSSSTPTQQVSIYQKVGYTSVGDVDSVSGWVLPGNYYEVHDYAGNCDPANYWWTEWF